MQSSDLRGISRLLERWFDRHQRPLPWRSGYEPFSVWVSEVMLQQTRMEVVLPFFTRFLARFPDIGSLAAATEDEVVSAWSGLGYYRRAKLLRAGALAVAGRFSGALPRTVDELRTIPGIGRYTAGAIASIAFNQRAPIVDGNVMRVLARVFGENGDPWHRAGELVAACSSPRALNQAVMELGALVCQPRNPACLLCPLKDLCVARTTGTIDRFPAAKERKASTSMRIVLFIVRDRRGHVLMHRVSGPLMDAMIHLPHGDDTLLRAQPLAATPGALLGTFRHTITNRRIEFVVHNAALPGRRPKSYEWIDPTQIDRYPHPSYVRKALALL